MKKSTFMYLVLSLMCFVGYTAFAADAAPAPDLSVVLMALWGAIQGHASTSVILVPIFQLLRTHEVVGILSKFSGKWMSTIVAVITTAGFILDAKVKGQSLASAFVTGLITSGGAMYIYDAYRSMKAPVQISAPTA